MLCILTAMSPKQRFQIMIEPEQLAALKAIEARNGATVAAQIRLAVDAYLQQQSVLSKSELRRIAKG